MCASSLFDGDAHSADQMPILLAGKGGGTLKTGRVLDYLDKGDDNRRACSLYLSLMDRMGVKLDASATRRRAWPNSRLDYSARRASTGSAPAARRAGR